MILIRYLEIILYIWNKIDIPPNPNKKADIIMLDVKVGNGALMKTLDDAKKLATTMVKIGKAYISTVLNGEKVGWAHDAIIYDEKPLTLKQSWVQRRRWMQGFTDVASRYFFKLLNSFFVLFLSSVIEPIPIKPQILTFFN